MYSRDVYNLRTWVLPPPKQPQFLSLLSIRLQIRSTANTHKLFDSCFEKLEKGLRSDEDDDDAEEG